MLAAAGQAFEELFTPPFHAALMKCVGFTLALLIGLIIAVEWSFAHFVVWPDWIDEITPDAELFMEISKSMFGVKLRWFDAIVSGLGSLRLNVNDVVWLQHPEATLDLGDGKLAVITGIEEDSSSDKIILEIESSNAVSNSAGIIP